VRGSAPRGTNVRSSSEGDRWEVELRALREELSELRAEQREMAKAIDQLVTTFRTLAAHLGIAAEPYVRKERTESGRDLPGFG
jgi:hypothetical protein